MSPRRQPEEHRRPPGASEHPTSDDPVALQLAQTLIALHRSERAPRAVAKAVQSGLAGAGEPASRRARWARRLERWRLQLAGWPLAGAAALVPLLLITWHQRSDGARREAAEAALLQAEQRSKELASKEVTLSGVVVSGSVRLRMYGDDIGMGHCEGSFRLALEGAVHPGAAHQAPIQVRWTRCDLPDEVSEELRRPFSPLRGPRPLHVTVRGHWAHAREFEALGLRLQP